MIRRRSLNALMAALLLAACSGTALAAGGSEPDTDARMVDAKVVEVGEHRISVIARTGVEHVIAVDSSGTKVRLRGKLVSPKELRAGDVVTVELDERSQLKFASHIEVAVQADSELASTEP